MTATEQIPRIAGVVVLYNPEFESYDSILSYLHQVQRLFVIDNSTNYNNELLTKLLTYESVQYVNCNGNRGIAYALNVGIRLAQEEQFEYVLTMDQDTILPGDFIRLLSSSEHLNKTDLKKIAILAPRYGSQKTKERCEDVLTTMTSGNLLSLSAFRDVGPFLEELFIDHVDHEYCLRLNANGYRVVQCNWIALPHEPGQRKVCRLLTWNVSFVSHSPIRLYYFCRNGLYISKLYGKLYPQYRWYFLRSLSRELIKIMFENQKWKRLRLVVLGILDHLKNRLGPFNHSL